jgi:hypothetical protein
MICLIIAYVFSSTKLEKRAEQVLLGSEWGGQGREMSQTMYAHMNKWINKPKNIKWGKGNKREWLEGESN